MKKHLLLICFTVFSMLSSLALSAKETVTISTGEYSPFVSAKLKHNGYVSHVIQRAFALQGIDVRFKYLPWKRAYVEAKNGRYDATSFWYDSDERKQDFYYSDAVNQEKTVFFYRKTEPLKNWDTLEDLTGFTIGATIGYTYTKEFWDAAEAKKIKVSSTSKDLTNMKKLVAGRVDLFPAGMVLGNTLLNENFDPAISRTIDYHSKPLTAAPGYLLFPKSSANSERLLALFNEGLKQLQESGELDKMFDELISGGYRMN